MPTAIGTYATRTLVKARFDSGTSYTAADDALIDDLCEGINAFVESETGRPICPLSATEIVLDGNLAEEEGLVMPVPFGLNTLTTLEIAIQTGATFVTVPATDYFLRPLARLRRVGWPATLIRLTDRPSAGNSTPRFYPGLENVRLRGSAGFAGWPAIPDDLTQMAVTAVVRAWASRMSGESDIIGTDEYGRPIVSWRIGARDRAILERYSVRPRTAGNDRLVTSYG